MLQCPRNKPASSHAFFLPKTAPVSAFARSFVSQRPIVGATITILEDEKYQFKTDSEGKFGPFLWLVGYPLTLRLEKKGSWLTGYYATQSATIIVPPEGFNDSNYLKHISFQVPSNMAFTLLSWTMGLSENKSACQIAATITPPGMTMDDIPQGEAEVQVSLSPDPYIKPRYLGVFPLIHKTNFFYCGSATSLDGGVIFPNVPEGTYTLTAKKGEQVSKITVTARKGVLVNASPPHGPIMLGA